MIKGNGGAPHLPYKIDFIKLDSLAHFPRIHNVLDWCTSNTQYYNLFVRNFTDIWFVPGIPTGEIKYI